MQLRGKIWSGDALNVIFSFFCVENPLFYRLPHVLSTTLSLHNPVDPPLSHLRQTPSYVYFKRPNIYLLERSLQPISQSKKKVEKYLPVGSFLLEIRFVKKCTHLLIQMKKNHAQSIHFVFLSSLDPLFVLFYLPSVIFSENIRKTTYR